MGVRGLATYLKRNKKEIGYEIDMCGRRMAIDLDSFVYYCAEKVIQKKFDRHECYWKVMLMDVGAMDDVVREYLDMFKNTELIAVQDAPKGIGKHTEMKRFSWKIREEEREKRAMAIGEKWKNGQSLYADEVLTALGVPSLMVCQVYHTLRKLDIPIVTCLEEGEKEIARLVQRGEYDYCLSYDSDCALMNYGRYIEFGNVFMCGQEAKALVYTPDRLAKHLNIPQDRLPDLSILCGNDYSEEMFARNEMQTIVPSLPRSSQNSITPCYINQAIIWIQNNQKLVHLVQSEIWVETRVQNIYDAYGYLGDGHYDVEMSEKFKIVQIMTDLKLSTSTMSMKIARFCVGKSGVGKTLLGKFSNSPMKSKNVVYPTMDDLCTDIRKLKNYIFFGFNNIQPWKINLKHSIELTSKNLSLDSTFWSSHSINTRGNLYEKLQSLIGGNLPLSLNSASKRKSKSNAKSMYLLLVWLCKPEDICNAQPTFTGKNFLSRNGPRLSEMSKLHVYALSALVNAICVYNDRAHRVAKVSGLLNFGGIDIRILLLTGLISVSTNQAQQKELFNTITSRSESYKNATVLYDWYCAILHSIIEIMLLFGLGGNCCEPQTLISSDVFAFVLGVFVKMSTDSENTIGDAVFTTILVASSGHEMAKGIYDQYLAKIQLVSKLFKEWEIKQECGVLVKWQASSSLHTRGPFQQVINAVNSTLWNFSINDEKAKFHVGKSRMDQLSNAFKRTSIASPKIFHQGVIPINALGRGHRNGARKEMAVDIDAAKTPITNIDLPIYEHTNEILETISNKRVIVISAPTGSGKSCGVAKMLLENVVNQPGMKNKKIFITQPRRIAATSLANRVAALCNESIGHSIGYKIGSDTNFSWSSKIIFVTTGYLLEYLSSYSETLVDISIIVLDEAHERSVDADSLLLVIRLLMEKYPALKVIVMSATLETDIYKKYFSKKHQFMVERIPKHEIATLYVGARMYDVEEIYLNEISERCTSATSSICALEKDFSRYANMKHSANKAKQVSQSTIKLQIACVIDLLPIVIRETQSNRMASNCVLVFLPGVSHIDSLFETLTSETWKYILRVFVLHSQMESDEQDMALRPLPPNEACRFIKVVLATNIAESSITIPDITHIINLGIEKRVELLANSNAEVLVSGWCSQASNAQRKGRAGRVRRGTCFHLFPSSFAKSLSEFTIPEMLRKPLDKVILNLMCNLSKFGTPSMLLHEALTAPKPKHVAASFESLYKAGAIWEQDGHGEVTRLGQIACMLPVDIRVTKFLLMGLSMGMICDAVIVGALLSMNGLDLFISPSKYHCKPLKYLDEMNKNLMAKLSLNADMWSEPLALYVWYTNWLSCKGRKKQTRALMAESCSISHVRLLQFNQSISDLCIRLVKVLQNTEVFHSPHLEAIQKLTVLANLVHGVPVDGPSVLTMNIEALRFMLAVTSTKNLGFRSAPIKGMVHDGTVQSNAVIKILERHLEVANMEAALNIFSDSKSHLDVKQIAVDQFSIRCSANLKAKRYKIFPFVHANLLLAKLNYCRAGKFTVVIPSNDEDNVSINAVCINSTKNQDFQVMSFKDTETKISCNPRSVCSVPLLDDSNSSTPALWGVSYSKLYLSDAKSAIGSHWSFLPTTKYPMYVPLLLLLQAKDPLQLWVLFDAEARSIHGWKIGSAKLILPNDVQFPADKTCHINTIREDLQLTIQFHQCLLCWQTICDEVLQSHASRGSSLKNRTWVSIPWMNSTVNSWISIFDFSCLLS